MFECSPFHPKSEVITTIVLEDVDCAALTSAQSVIENHASGKQAM